MPSTCFLPVFNYYQNFPTYKQIRAWSGVIEDECPDELYHFSVKDFHCCIVHNVRVPSDCSGAGFDRIDRSSLFGSYSVRVLGLPPKIGVWQSYYTGDFYNAVAKFRELVRKYLDGYFALD